MRAKILLAFTLMSFCTAVYSECGPGYCRGTGAQAIQTATVTQNGALFMVPTGASIGCALVEGVYMQLNDTHPHFKEIYATYLAAVATDSYFQIGVDGSATCTVSYIRTWN